ncbi:MAG: hypothetical protein PHU34_09705 [Candidatus Methanoperedens sp.]|nr:hypothetical protein [Candidatus Methanoperedens sp.]
MKKLMQYIIPVFLIVFLASPAFGFAGMTASNSTIQPELDPGNATDSDQDLVLVQHLIEVDAVQLQSENKLLVRETLVFKNTGNKNFSGKLRTWVQDGAEIITTKDSGEIVRQGVIQRRNMMDGRFEYSLKPTLNGNIVSWTDTIGTKSLPPLYAMEYLLPAEPKGTITKTKLYSKILLYPTLTKQPANFVLKVTRNKDERITIIDEKGVSISASGNAKDVDNSVLYGWEMPEFKEFKIEISKPAVSPAGIAGYVVIGLILILVFSYPIIRKKSEKLRAIEEKIRNALKSKKTEETEEEATAETDEEPASEAHVETGEPISDEELAEYEGKTRDELENLENELLSKLDGLEKDYSSGNMLDEEYDEFRKSYQEKIDKITSMIEQHG